MAPAGSRRRRLLGRYNLINLHPVAGIDLVSGCSLSTAAVFYRRVSLSDGIYGNAGDVLHLAGGSRARYLVSKAEVFHAWEATRGLSFEASYAFLAQGRFIAETSLSRNVQLIGADTQCRFWAVAPLGNI